MKGNKFTLGGFLVLAIFLGSVLWTPEVLACRYSGCTHGPYTDPALTNLENKVPEAYFILIQVILPAYGTNYLDPGNVAIRNCAPGGCPYQYITDKGPYVFADALGRGTKCCSIQESALAAQGAWCYKNGDTPHGLARVDRVTQNTDPHSYGYYYRLNFGDTGVRTSNLDHAMAVHGRYGFAVHAGCCNRDDDHSYSPWKTPHCNSEESFWNSSWPYIAYLRHTNGCVRLFNANLKRVYDWYNFAKVFYGISTYVWVLREGTGH